MVPERRQSVALLFMKDGKILSVSRLDNHLDVGLPGGKVEPGETLEEAARRETLEEVGVRILEMREVFVLPCCGYEAYTFLVDSWEGEPVSLEGAAVGWVEPARLLTSECTFRDYNLSLFRAVGVTS